MPHRTMPHRSRPRCSSGSICHPRVAHATFPPSHPPISATGHPLLRPLGATLTMTSKRLLLPPLMVLHREKVAECGVPTDSTAMLGPYCFSQCLAADVAAAGVALNDVADECRVAAATAAAAAVGATLSALWVVNAALCGVGVGAA